MSVYNDLRELLTYAEDRASRDLILATELNGLGGTERHDLVEDRAKRKQWLADLRPKLDEYVLLHRSHIEVQQRYSIEEMAYLTRAAMTVMNSSATYEREVLAAHDPDALLDRAWRAVHDRMVKYLEEPKPVPTQSDPS